MKKALLWITSILVIIIVVVIIIFKVFLEQKPFATSNDYWTQLENHKLTPDVIGHWNHWLGTNDAFSFSQNPVFELPSDPYDIEIYKKLADAHRYDKEVIDEVFVNFLCHDEYGCRL